MKKLNEFEKGYITGLLEGEGTIYIRTNRVREEVSIQIANNSIALLENVKTILGTGSITHRPKSTSTYKVSAVHDVLSLLNQLMPYLIVKRQKTMKAVTVCEEKIENNKARWNSYLLTGIVRTGRVV